MYVDAYVHVHIRTSSSFEYVVGLGYTVLPFTLRITCHLSVFSLYVTPIIVRIA